MLTLFFQQNVFTHSRVCLSTLCPLGNNSPNVKQKLTLADGSLRKPIANIKNLDSTQRGVQRQVGYSPTSQQWLEISPTEQKSPGHLVQLPLQYFSLSLPTLASNHLIPFVSNLPVAGKASGEVLKV